MNKHFYGSIPSRPDARDFKFTSIRANTPLPPSIDLRPFCSPVRDQGQLGSCTGFGIVVGLREQLELRVSKKLVKLAPMFTYYEERVIEGDVSEDAGAEPRDGLKTLVNLGVAPESYDRYNVNTFTHAPSGTALKFALKYKISAFHSISNLNGVKVCLAGGTGVVMGFTVYESFEGDALASTGVMPMPKAGEAILGGHCVFGAGYKDDPAWPGGGYLIVKNSWGTSWGDKGWLYMPYAFVTHDNVSDLWTGTL